MTTNKSKGPATSTSSGTGPPASFAASTPPIDLNAGGELRLLLKEMAELNARFDNLAKPPTFRVADVVGLVAALIAIAVFVATQFSISDRLDKAEVRLTRSQERIADDVGKVRTDVTDLRTRAAVLEDRRERRSEK